MLKGRNRPNDMVFAACRHCNNGTRSADVVAAFVSRLGGSNDITDWRVGEAISQINPIVKNAPEILRELFDPLQVKREWRRNKGGLLLEQIVIDGKKPYIDKYLSVFAAKMGMALYRRHIGKPIPLDGIVQTLAILNGYINQDIADRFLKNMPFYSTLRQGKFEVSEQFRYRYNTDDQDIISALIQFHEGLFIWTASASAKYADKIPKISPFSTFTKPGSF